VTSALATSDAAEAASDGGGGDAVSVSSGSTLVLPATSAGCLVDGSTEEDSSLLAPSCSVVDCARAAIGWEGGLSSEAGSASGPIVDSAVVATVGVAEGSEVGINGCVGFVSDTTTGMPAYVVGAAIGAMASSVGSVTGAIGGGLSTPARSAAGRATTVGVVAVEGSSFE